WGVGPEAADRFHRLRRGERPLPANQPIADAAFALFAVAGRAFLRENRASLLNRPPARRQFLAVAADIDVPAGDFLVRGSAPEAELAALGMSRDSEYRQEQRRRQNLKL